MSKKRIKIVITGLLIIIFAETVIGCASVIQKDFDEISKKSISNICPALGTLPLNDKNKNAIMRIKHTTPEYVEHYEEFIKKYGILDTVNDKKQDFVLIRQNKEINVLPLDFVFNAVALRNKSDIKEFLNIYKEICNNKPPFLNKIQFCKKKTSNRNKVIKKIEGKKLIIRNLKSKFNKLETLKAKNTNNIKGFNSEIVNINYKIKQEYDGICGYVFSAKILRRIRRNIFISTKLSTLPTSECIKRMPRYSGSTVIVMLKNPPRQDFSHHRSGSGYIHTKRFYFYHSTKYIKNRFGGKTLIYVFTHKIPFRYKKRLNKIKKLEKRIMRIEAKKKKNKIASEKIKKNITNTSLRIENITIEFSEMRKTLGEINSNLKYCER